MDSITINLKQVAELAQDGEDIFLTPDAEASLVKLLEIQEEVEQAVKTLKENLEAKGLEVNPNFKAIQGDLVRIGYRYFGSEYGIDPAYADEVPEELKKTTVKHTVDTKALAEYMKQHEGLPVGIIHNDRKKTITIGFKKGATNDEE